MSGQKMTVPKIVYLFGAGATHAEILNLYPSKSGDAIFLKNNGLLLKHISERVIENAIKDGAFNKRQIKQISPAGLSNIELYISLLSMNQIESEKIIKRIKELLKIDITDKLTTFRLSRFYLHKALIEFHSLINEKEKLLGSISLNYDSVLDDAYKGLSFEPDYGLYSSSKTGEKAKPLLKLHGGFNLDYRGSSLSFITPGINKNYLELPYNFVWGRALELLIGCDQFRIVGCSLSPNDIGLIDLLFKAHFMRKQSRLEIQMINFDRDYNLGDRTSSNEMKKSYGFFPDIKTALELESGLITDLKIRDDTSGSNPFKIWLKAKVDRAKTEKLLTDHQIKKTRYIKKLFV